MSHNFKKSNKFKITKPWINNEIKSLITLKNKLFKKYKKSHSLELYNKYKLHRNKTNNAIKFAKKQYYEHIFKQYIGDAKGTWHILKSLINKNKDIKNISIINNNVRIDDPITIANTFNDFFTNLFSSPSEVDMAFKTFLNPSNTSSIFFEPVSSYEIIQHAKTLTNSTTNDSHNLSNKILKKNY